MKLEDIDHTELIAKGIVCLRFKNSNDYTADLKQIPPPFQPIPPHPQLYMKLVSHTTL